MHKADILAIVVILLGLWPLSMQADCVVLLHGLARTSKAMTVLEEALIRDGYRVSNVDYPSRKKTIEELSGIAVGSGLEECAAKPNERVHFVTHSMGGILVRYYFEHHQIENLGHVVMIAPPNQGSEVVDQLAKMPGFKWVNGPAGLQLGTDENSVPLQLGSVEYSVGVIAGNQTFNPVLSQFLPNPDDGKVSVENTKVEGMRDFRVVAASHPFIMKDEWVIKHTISFINHGAFLKMAPETGRAQDP